MKEPPWDAPVGRRGLAALGVLVLIGAVEEMGWGWMSRHAPRAFGVAMLVGVALTVFVLGRDAWRTLQNARHRAAGRWRVLSTALAVGGGILLFSAHDRGGTWSAAAWLAAALSGWRAYRLGRRAISEVPHV